MRHPNVDAMIPCDTIMTESNGLVSLIRLYNSICPNTLPAVIRVNMLVLTRHTEKAADLTLTVSPLNEIMGQPMVSSSMRATYLNPNANHYWTSTMFFSVETHGWYIFDLKHENEIIASRRIEVIAAPPQGATFQ